jgi:hypothetical protein
MKTSKSKVKEKFIPSIRILNRNGWFVPQVSKKGYSSISWCNFCLNSSSYYTNGKTLKFSTLTAAKEFVDLVNRNSNLFLVKEIKNVPRNIVFEQKVVLQEK